MQTIAVIGAGPAGMAAALAAAGECRILLIERNRRPGRKLLITGSGQCNLTHAGEISDFLEHYNGAGRFLKPALYRLPPAKLLKLFTDRGVEFETESSGKVFPRSRRAGDILGSLEAALREAGVEYRGNSAVERIEREGSGYLIAGSAGELCRADAVVLACGGTSYPATGSDGSGYALAAALGHTVEPPRPALTDVELEEYGLADCAGISVAARLLHLRNGKRIARYEGDLLLTHRGFSGPVIINNSRDIAPQDLLVPDFFGADDSAEVRLVDWARQNGRKGLKSIARIVTAPENLTARLIESAGLDGERKLASLSREERRRLLEAFRGREYRVAALGGFTRAMCTAGGVRRDEIDARTMQSRSMPGIYFAGEIIDVDGDTGGYNLQAAFSTGFLAGSSARRQLSIVA